MAATMLDELELNNAQAKKIVKLAIEQGAYEHDMPTDRKKLMEAAHASVAFCIDAWQNDGIRPDDDDEEVAEGAKAVLEIFEIAGIEADEDGSIEFNGSDDDDDDDSDADDDNGDDDEGPFDPDDYIEGYSELTAKSKIAAINDLDEDDEDYYPLLEAIKEWEEEQDKPSSRVLSIVEEILEEASEESGDDDDDSDDSDDDDADDDGDGEDGDEPWEGYDSLTAKAICDALKDAAKDEDEPLTLEQLEYVEEYESNREKPLKRVLTLIEKLKEQVGEGDDDSDDDDAEEPKARKRGRRGSKDPDDDDAVDDAVDRDDEREERKGRRKKSSGTTITLTREQILEALENGEVEIEV